MNPLISFCTTCMNRVFHLKETLRSNMNVVKGSPYEFIVLNYNSKDDMESWINNNFRNELKNGVLKYHKTTTPTKFLMSHSKNCVHKLGNGEFLVNLDADNFLTREYVSALVNSIKAGFDLTAFLPCENVWGGGYGRVSVRKKVFHAVGGYDEEMIGWGYEDNDFINRIKELNYKFVGINGNFADFISHSDALRNYTDDKLKSRKFNEEKSKLNIKNKKFVANIGKNWGKL